MLNETNISVLIRPYEELIERLNARIAELETRNFALVRECSELQSDKDYLLNQRENVTTLQDNRW